MLQYLGSGYIGSFWTPGSEGKDGQLDDLETILNSPAPALGAPAGIAHPASPAAEVELNTLAGRLPLQGPQLGVATEDTRAQGQTPADQAVNGGLPEAAEPSEGSAQLHSAGASTGDAADMAILTPPNSNQLASDMGTAGGLASADIAAPAPSAASTAEPPHHAERVSMLSHAAATAVAALPWPVWRQDPGHLVAADPPQQKALEAPSQHASKGSVHSGLMQWVPELGHYERATVAMSLVGAGVGGVVAGPLGMAAGAKSGALMVAAGAGVCGAAHQYYAAHRRPTPAAPATTNTVTSSTLAADTASTQAPAASDAGADAESGRLAVGQQNEGMPGAWQPCSLAAARPASGDLPVSFSPVACHSEDA